MSIKDNFSQAVKELWKKDGQDEQPAAPAQPSELDGYLRQTAAQVPPVQPPIGEQIPPVAPVAPVQPAAPVQQAAPAQPVQPAQNAQQAVPPVQPAAQGAPMQNAGGMGVPLETPYYRADTPQQTQASAAQTAARTQQGGFPQGFAQPAQTSYDANSGFGGGYVPPVSGDNMPQQPSDQTDEVTVISKNTIIDGNVRSLANMQIDGNIKGNIETTRNIDMTGKVVGDITCNNAGMAAAAMQGNVSLKGRMRMDRDTILIGDLSSQYADINGRIRGKLDIAGKAELKRDAIVFGDINASTIAVTDGAIIQGYVNTTFLSKEDSRNAIPDAITFDSGKDGKNP